MIDGIPPNQDSKLPAAYAPERAPVLAQPRGAPPPFAGMEDPQGIPWARYFDAIVRQLWLIVLVSGLGITAGVYMSRRVSPIYTAEAVLLLTGSQYPSASTAIGGDPALRSQSSWDGLIKSYTVLDPVVRDLGNYIARGNRDSALFRSFSPPDTSVFRTFNRFQLVIDSTGNSYTLSVVNGTMPPEQGAVGDSIGRSFGFFWAPPKNLLTPRRVVEFGVNTIQATSTGLMGSLTTFLPEQGQFLKMRLSGTDPRRITVTLNAWAAQAVAAAYEYKKEGLDSSRKSVAAQLGSVAAQLQADEAALQKFREENIMLAPDNTSATATASQTTYLQLKGQLDAITLTRKGLDSAMTDFAATGKVKPEGYFLIPSALANWPFLKTNVDTAVALEGKIEGMLRGGRTRENESVRPFAIQDSGLVRVTLPGITRDIIQQLKLQESTISAQMDALQVNMHSIPLLAIENQRRMAKVAASQAIYNSLQARHESIRLAVIETTADLKFFQPAIQPRFPSSNTAPRLLLMAIVASIGAGLALALLRDRVDRRFRYPEQAVMDLGLTIVGTVPVLSFNRRGEMSVAAMSQVVESFRTLRLAIRHQFPADQPVVLCVSSAGPSEGKSLVSSNLAVAFANAGQKTLLIDGDVRRGVVHTTFSAERRPGLVDYLGGNVAAKGVVQSTSTPNLSVIASGARSRRAPEFLVSERMAALVAEMRGQFDVIIVDSAPFVAGMDAYALGAAAGAMLIVLRKGVTDRKLAAAKLEIVDRLPVSILGTVVNGISSDRSYRYYSYDSDYAVDESMKEEAEFADAGTVPAVARLTGPK